MGLKILFVLGLVMAAPLAPLEARAGGKAMDCAECKEAFGEGPACTPICAPKVKGKKAQELYSALQGLGIGACTKDECYADLKSVDCSWSNSVDSRRASCDYVTDNKKKGTVEGAKARRLRKAMEATGHLEISCGAGTCGFRNAQEVKCDEQRRSKNKKLGLNYSCKLLIAEGDEPAENPKAARPNQTELPAQNGPDPARSAN